jgi:hypothetical protein
MKNNPYCTICQINECKVGNSVDGVAGSTRTQNSHQRGCECHAAQQCLFSPSSKAELCTEFRVLPPPGFERRSLHGVEAGSSSGIGLVSMGSIVGLETRESKGKGFGEIGMKPGGDCLEPGSSKPFCEIALLEDL